MRSQLVDKRGRLLGVEGRTRKADEAMRRHGRRATATKLRVQYRCRQNHDVFLGSSSSSTLCPLHSTGIIGCVTTELVMAAVVVMVMMMVVLQTSQLQ